MGSHPELSQCTKKQGMRPKTDLSRWLPGKLEQTSYVAEDEPQLVERLPSVHRARVPSQHCIDWA